MQNASTPAPMSAATASPTPGPVPAAAPSRRGDVSTIWFVLALGVCVALVMGAAPVGHMMSGSDQDVGLDLVAEVEARYGVTIDTARTVRTAPGSSTEVVATIDGQAHGCVIAVPAQGPAALSCLTPIPLVRP